MSKFILTLFIFIFLVIQTHEICDTISVPNTLTDCTKHNPGDKYGDYCCFYESVKTPPTKHCKIVPYSTLQNVMTHDMIGKELFSVNCGTDTGKSVLSPCGEEVENPSVSACKSYSSYVDSCCFFDQDNAIGVSYPVTQTGCYWLGSKYMGDITWGSLKLKCSSQYNNLSIWMLLITIFIHILI